MKTNCKPQTANPEPMAHSRLCGLCALVAKFLLVAGLLLLGANACTTVAPKAPQAAAASWDGTNANSGVIGWQGSELEITAHARDRYNGLISLYSKRFLPPLTPDYGLRATGSNTFVMSPEAIAQFATMNRWRKQNLNP